MSSAEGSCARTRGWQGEYKSLQRYTALSPTSADQMSSESERWSDGSDASEPSEKGFSGLREDLGGLRVSSKQINVHRKEADSRDVNITEDEDITDKDGRDEKGFDGNESKKVHDETRKKHKVKHDKKERDHSKKSKRSHSDETKKERKKTHREADDKKSQSKDRRTEKPQRWERNIDWKDKHYSSSEWDTHKSSRYSRDERRPEWDEYWDDDSSQRRSSHWDSGKGHYYKSSSKGDRALDGKRAKYESLQRGSYRGRSSSRSPKSNTRSRSPSPQYRDREWVGHDKDASNKYRRFGGSGLGGYSPRRRRSDAAIKTPSPPTKSPERKKSRAWDLVPAGVDNNLMAAMAAVQQAAAQQAAALASVSSLVSVNPAVASVALTQATRSLRRLYVANVPAAVSDGELLEFLNAAMLSAGANHLPATKPCINCMVNAEKNYAFAEFLTPEDATAALAFDGVTLHGTTLKIRRPKDYVPLPSVGVGNALPVVDMVSSVVQDSPRKVFVGGICTTLSSDKVKEIVTAFGQLKAYHWEVKVREDNKKEVCAFIEYLDPSMTLKACSGLNGMRLGNNILTVVQATPDANEEPEANKPPFYDIPEHAKTLLQPPTRILVLQNVISEEEVVSISEADLKEIEEDVRLECVRFGTVKSMHVVRPQEEETAQVPEEAEVCNVDLDEQAMAEREGSETDNGSENFSGLSNLGPDQGGVDPLGSASTDTNVLVGQSIEVPPPDVPTMQKACEGSDNAKVEPNKEKMQIVTISEVKDVVSDSMDKCLPEDLGRIYVEFTREECARQAAHALHGRLYGVRKVGAGFFPLKFYQKRFGKGLEARTYEEKQALAVAALEHLNSYIKD